MRFIYLLLACAVTLVACNSTPPKTTTVDDTLNRSAPASAHLPVSVLNDEGTQTLLALVNKYYDVKNALIAVRPAAVTSAAQQLLIVADSLKTHMARTQAYHKDDTITISERTVPYLDTITAETKKIIAIANPTCEQQQVPFGKMSDAFFALLQKTGLKNARVYQQHCPMAFDGKGATWVSNEEEIKNPYFPKTMLECGDITDSLK